MSQSAEHSHSRRRLPGVPALGGFAVDRLNDVINLLRFLPEITTQLSAINHHVAHMDDEVTQMRQGVNRVEREVDELRTEIRSLATELQAVEQAVDRLEPHVADVGRLVRPLRRIRGRSGGRAGERPQLPQGNGDDDPPVAGLA